MNVIVDEVGAVATAGESDETTNWRLLPRLFHRLRTAASTIANDEVALGPATKAAREKPYEG
jgi:hypothetical protein